MNIQEAGKENLQDIVQILEQISILHCKMRPDMFKIKTINDIEKEAIDTIEDEERKVLIAIDENKVFGILIYKIRTLTNHNNLKDSKSLWIDEIGVDEKYRKNGIGQLLMDEAEKIAKKLKCERIELNCWDFNEIAYNFYKKQGMKNQRIIMEKRLEE